jgi:hypothetical protein
MSNHKQGLEMLTKSLMSATTKDELMIVQATALVGIYALLIEEKNKTSS